MHRAEVTIVPFGQPPESATGVTLVTLVPANHRFDLAVLTSPARIATESWAGAQDLVPNAAPRSRSMRQKVPGLLAKIESVENKLPLRVPCACSPPYRLSLDSG